MAEVEQDGEWLAVIGRSLAFLALQSAGLREKELAVQGLFLENLGLARREAAAMLGTTTASLSELYRQARKKRGGRRGRSKKR